MSNIKSLVRRQDVEGLLKAASYKDLAPSSVGTVSDRGIPVRTDAVLALGMLAPEAGLPAIRAGLGDPADQMRCAAVRVLRAFNEVGVLAQSLRWLRQDRGNARELASRAIIDLRKSVRPSVVADAQVHREDDDPLGERDAQMIVTLLEGERPVATDEVLELLVVALRAERGIAVDRAAEILVLLAPGSIGVLAAELHTGSTPAGAAHVVGRIGDPQTLDALAKALEHGVARVRAESAAALAENQDPAAVKLVLRATRDSERSVQTRAGMALDRPGTTAMVVGIAVLLEPMIRDAVRSGVARTKVDADGRTQPSPSPRQSRSRRANGGPPEIGHRSAACATLHPLRIAQSGIATTSKTGRLARLQDHARDAGRGCSDRRGRVTSAPATARVAKTIRGVPGSQADGRS
jgi:HEAT repeat protein